MINFFGTPINNGVTRAAARLAAHRKAQAERLKDAPEPVLSRQVSRRNMRMIWKQSLRAEKMARLKLPLAQRMAVAS